MKSYEIFKGPLGPMLMVEKNGFLQVLEFLEEGSLEEILPPNCQKKATITLETLSKELNLYFQGKLRTFSVSIDVSQLQGTLFQKKVWGALLTIPYGKTLSYKELAGLVGSPNGFRAVGNANGKNPISIVIPCHRVINHGGKLGGYTGGLDKKTFLLNIEGTL